jgi:hypothetical protein
VDEGNDENVDYEGNDKNQNYNDDDTNNDDNEGGNDLPGMMMNSKTENASMEDHEISEVIPGVSQDDIQDDETNNEAQAVTSDEITGVPENDILGVSG